MPRVDGGGDVLALNELGQEATDEAVTRTVQVDDLLLGYSWSGIGR